MVRVLVHAGRRRYPVSPGALDLQGLGVLFTRIRSDRCGPARLPAESLMVSLAAPRLRREGVPLPRTLFTEADTRLYRLLEGREGELARARYLARLRLLATFADACRSVREEQNPDAE